MTHKNYTLIPILVAIILIPQLLFWWLAPTTATSYLAVYIGGTLLTVGIPLAYYLTYWNSNLRKTAGLSVVAGILEIVVVALCALLLGIDASIRSTVFALIITALVCLIVLIPMITSALKTQKQGVYPAPVSRWPIDQAEPTNDNDNSPTYEDQSQKPMPHHTIQKTSVHKPLPPRNR